MNVIVGIRELRMSHIRAQVRKHSIQILAITHPMIQPVGCKSVTEVMKLHAAKPHVIPSLKHYRFPMGQPSLYLLYCSDNSNNIIPTPLILFRSG